MPAASTSRGPQAAGPMDFGLLSHVRLGMPRSTPGLGVEGAGLEVFAHGVIRGLPATRAVKGWRGTWKTPRRAWRWKRRRERGKEAPSPPEEITVVRLLNLPQGTCAGSGLRLLFCAERSWTCAAAPHILFLDPTELGKAIVDLQTEGNISVWDLSNSLVFSMLTN